MNLLDQTLTETLITISQSGTLTAAAEALFISQSALSRRVLQAEKQLGFPLLNRRQKPLRLSPEGQLYIDAVMKINDIYQGMQSEIQEMRNGERGMIRIGLSLSLSRGITHLFLPEFRKAWPRISIQLTERPSATLEELVQQNILDLAIVHAKNFRELQYRSVAGMPVYLSVPPMYPDYPALRRGLNQKLIPLRSLASFPFILSRKGSSLRREEDRMFQEAGFEPVIAAETGSIEVAEHLAQADLGFTFLPSAFVMPGRSTCCPLSGEAMLRPFYLCTRPSLKEGPAMEDLIRLIQAALRQYTAVPPEE